MRGMVIGALLMFSTTLGAQSLDHRWLGTPEPGDFLNPRAYWQRVLAVWQGAMTPDQVALVRQYVTRNTPPLGGQSTVAAPLTTTTRPGL